MSKTKGIAAGKGNENGVNAAPTPACEELMNLVQTAVVELDRRGRVRRMNRRTAEIFGYSTKELMGADWFSHCLPKDAVVEAKEVFKQLMAGDIEETEYHEQTMQAKSGNQRIISWHSTLVRDENGKIKGTLGSGIDVTEARRATAALLRSEENFRLIADFTYDWESWHEPDGTLYWTSPSVEDQTGYSVEECGAMENFPSPMLHPEDRKRVVALLRRCAETQEPLNDEVFRLIRKDGGVAWMALSGQPVFDTSGAYRGIRTNKRDITDRKLADDRIRQQAQEILEISTPMIRIWDGVVAAPLIGALDSQRTQSFMQRFLDAIVEHHCKVGLVDITGVPVIDTQTAQHLLESFAAARLLGAEVMLTGVRPNIAQTLVHLGLDVGTLKTYASLSVGLKEALRISGFEIARRS